MLLSLSQTSPNCTNSIPSPNMLIPGQPISHAYVSGFSAESSSQNSMSLSLKPKQSFDDQNTKTEAKSEQDLNDTQPMDLTKPRVEPKIEERRPKFKIAAPIAPPVPTYANPAGLLNTLMSNTDKVPALHQAIPSPLTPGVEYSLTPMVDESIINTNNAHMQSYITEQAMHKNKMRLSQINSNDKFNNTTTTATINIRPRKVLVASNLSFNEKLPTYYGKPTDVFDQLKRSDIHLKSFEQQQQQRNHRHSVDDCDKPLQLQNLTLKQRKISMPLMNVIDLNTKTKQPIELAIEKRMKNENANSNSNSLQEPEQRITITQSSETVFRIELSPAIVNNSDDQSGMDTLAEIAASSLKLDTTKSPIKTPQKNPTNLSIMSENANAAPENSAKNVASEYLKMTSAEYQKAHQSGNDANVNDERTKNFNLIEENSSNFESFGNESPLKKFGQSLQADRSSPATATAMISTRTVIVGDDGLKPKAANSNNLNKIPVVQFPLASNPTATATPANRGVDGGRSVCPIPNCSKTFLKEHQMRLHMNIHYMNPHHFKCETCYLSFRTQGLLRKHERSEEHMKKANDQVTASNPRPHKCIDCNIAFRKKGYLAKHLRSKGHVQKLECVQKLPFGTYAAIERAGNNLTCIDTIDCDEALRILKVLAQQLLVDKDIGGKSNMAFNTNGNMIHGERVESTSEDGELFDNSNTLTKKISMSDAETSDIEIGENHAFSNKRRKLNESSAS